MLSRRRNPVVLSGLNDLEKRYKSPRTTRAPSNPQSRPTSRKKVRHSTPSPDSRSVSPQLSVTSHRISPNPSLFVYERSPSPKRTSSRVEVSPKKSSHSGSTNTVTTIGPVGPTGPAGLIGPTGANGMSVFPSGCHIYVDSTFGNNSTGQRQDKAKPFSTLSAAQNIALSGDLIIVRPCTYTAQGLGKNGVNWFFEPGSIVNLPDNCSSIFCDPMNASYTVRGYGSFYGGRILELTGNGNIIFEGDVLDSLGSGYPAIRVYE